MKEYTLSAVRLVGFHNFEDVTIPVRGDLFIVGANESGKTTVLDAIHLVLSGEQDLDWNSSARLVGARDEGRDLRGIILRADLSGEAQRRQHLLRSASARSYQPERPANVRDLWSVGRGYARPGAALGIHRTSAPGGSGADTRG